MALEGFDFYKDDATGGFPRPGTLEPGRLVDCVGIAGHGGPLG